MAGRRLRDLTVVVPARGPVTDELGDLASVRELDFAPLMLPGGAAGAARRPGRCGGRPTTFAP